MSKTTIKRIAIALFIILFLIIVYFCIGQPILAFVNDRESLQEFIASRGALGWVVFCLFMEKNYAVLIAGAIFAILVYSGLMIYLKKKKVA